MTNYASAIKKSGPLKNDWCMTFQSNHRFFKKAVQISCNFINVSLTACKKFQLRKCFQILGTEKFTSSSHNILCSESTKLNIYEFRDIISTICRIDINENIEVIQKAEVNNTIYCSGYFLYLRYHEFDTCFGKIVSCGRRL